MYERWDTKSMMEYDDNVLENHATRRSVEESPLIMNHQTRAAAPPCSCCWSNVNFEFEMRVPFSTLIKKKILNEEDMIFPHLDAPGEIFRIWVNIQLISCLTRIKQLPSCQTIQFVCRKTRRSSSPGKGKGDVGRNPYRRGSSRTILFQKNSHHRRRRRRWYIRKRHTQVPRARTRGIRLFIHLFMCTYITLLLGRTSMGIG